MITNEHVITASLNDNSGAFVDADWISRSIESTRECMTVYSANFHITVQEQCQFIRAHSFASDIQLIKFGSTSLLSLFVTSGLPQEVR